MSWYRARLTQLLCLFAHALGLLAAAPVAWANGRLPFAGQIAADPTTPGHVLTRTSYGLLQTLNGGVTWHWLCENAVGYDDTSDPFVAIAGGGHVLVATGKQVLRGAPNGCDWAPVALPGGATAAVDLVVDRTAPDRVTALLVQADGRARLAQSEDAGATWQWLGQPLPANLAALTVERPAGLPARLYVSVRGGVELPWGAVARSDDAGQHWQVQPIVWAADALQLPSGATLSSAEAYLSAISPIAPDQLFLRLTSAAGHALLRSDDAGAHWTALIGSVSPLLGLAVSPDGAQVAVSAFGTDLSLRVGPVLGPLAVVGQPGARCLTWTPAGLWLCGEESLVKYTVGRSTDAGLHVTAVHRRKELQPSNCTADSRVGQQCSPLWPLQASQLGVPIKASQLMPAPTPAPASGCLAGRVPAFGWSFVGVLLVVWRRRKR